MRCEKKKFTTETKEQNTNAVTNEEICCRITKQYNIKEQENDQIRHDEK